MGGKEGAESEVNWNGILEPEERRRIHERIHSAFGAVGARIPEIVVSGGRKLRLKDLVFTYLNRERLSAEDLEAVDAVTESLRRRVEELDRSILHDDISEKGAVELMREVLGMLRALEHLRSLREDPGRAGPAHSSLMQRVDDERRWRDFLKRVR
ncbi:MAG: hypothetical protein FJ149_00790 [Euryarchaeota archaeon]|nr:hypothetical protein [Euryarchaeota archaeon]